MNVWGSNISEGDHVFFFLIQHLYSATSKLVLRRGGPKQGPTLDGVGHMMRV